MPDEDLMTRTVEEAARKQTRMLESLASAYLQQTGLTADLVELVERADGFKIIWYFRKKGSSD